MSYSQPGGWPKAIQELSGVFSCAAWTLRVFAVTRPSLLLVKQEPLAERILSNVKPLFALSLVSLSFLVCSHASSSESLTFGE